MQYLGLSYHGLSSQSKVSSKLVCVNYTPLHTMVTFSRYIHSLVHTSALLPKVHSSHSNYPLIVCMHLSDIMAAEVVWDLAILRVVCANN